MNPDDNETNQNQEESNVPRKEVSELTLAYLTCPQDASNAFLGALMLTDYRTRPLHFSFVSPIRPTSLQKMLYGSTLEEYLKVDLISQKLLKGMPQMPDILFVDAHDLLSARRVTNIPTAFLAKNPNTQNQPDRLTTLEYKTDLNTEDQETVGQILAATNGGLTYKSGDTI